VDRTQEERDGIPTPTAEHLLCAADRPLRIGRRIGRLLRVVVGLVPILHPFLDVTSHVQHAIRAGPADSSRGIGIDWHGGGRLADRRDGQRRIEVKAPGIDVVLGAARRTFPLGFGRQAPVEGVAVLLGAPPRHQRDRVVGVELGIADRVGLAVEVDVAGFLLLNRERAGLTLAHVLVAVRTQPVEECHILCDGHLVYLHLEAVDDDLMRGRRVGCPLDLAFLAIGRAFVARLAGFFQRGAHQVGAARHWQHLRLERVQLWGYRGRRPERDRWGGLTHRRRADHWRILCQRGRRSGFLL